MPERSLCYIVDGAPRPVEGKVSMHTKTTSVHDWYISSSRKFILQI